MICDTVRFKPHPRDCVQCCRLTIEDQTNSTSADGRPIFCHNHSRRRAQGVGSHCSTSMSGTGLSLDTAALKSHAKAYSSPMIDRAFKARSFTATTPVLPALSNSANHLQQQPSSGAPSHSMLSTGTGTSVNSEWNYRSYSSSSLTNASRAPPLLIGIFPEQFWVG